MEKYEEEMHFDSNKVLLEFFDKLPTYDKDGKYRKFSENLSESDVECLQKLVKFAIIEGIQTAETNANYRMRKIHNQLQENALEWKRNIEHASFRKDGGDPVIYVRELKNIIEKSIRLTFNYYEIDKEARLSFSLPHK